MMMLLGSQVQRWRQTFKRILEDPELRPPLLAAGSFLTGLCLSAASLGNHLQPFCLGVLCAGLPGWLPAWYAIGSALGYWMFWGIKGLQGILWIAAALPVGVLVARWKGAQRMELLLPAFGSLIVAAGGVIFQSWRGENTYIAMYLLRVGLAFGAVWIVQLARQKHDTTAGWIAIAVAVLSLAQIAPVVWMNLGMVAAAVLVVALPLPAVAMIGLALDLAQVTPVSMTAVLSLVALLRLLPKLPARVMAAMPAAVYILIMALCGQMDLLPLPPLMLGGVLGMAVPGDRPRLQRRGETGAAQVRLELVASVMAQAEQLLQEAQGNPIDEAAQLVKVADRACTACPSRKGCKAAEHIQRLPVSVLHQGQIHMDDLPLDCKKRSRLLTELRRSQDQLRLLYADHQRRQEYRNAVIQQYHFLSEYLQDLADQLPQRTVAKPQRFQPEVAVCSTGKEMANGDRCMWFAGTQLRYYLLLCDGMGTGPAAAEEAKTAGNLLRRLLMAGYPAQYALRSLNSLCALRGKAGTVTLDLAEFRLDTGKVSVYKWGAAPSWLLLTTGPEQIGAGGIPPGMSVTDARETVDNLTMRHGEVLVMLSDGVDAAAALKNTGPYLQEPAGTLAARLLEQGRGDGMDDATVAVIRLDPI